MRNLFLLGLSFVLSTVCSWAQPERTFDWVRASDEIVQLDPTDFHAGRVYRPGPDGGNIHVIIHAMMLVLHDERTPDRAIIQGIGAIVSRRARQLVSPNDVQITYHSWSCVQNCVQPEYKWFLVAKEKYDLSTSAKLYSVTPEHDGQRMWVKIKSKVPMTLAILPSKIADQAYDKPETISSAL